MSAASGGFDLPVVYITPDCQPCRLTKRKLKERGIAFEEVDLTKDEEALALVRSWGYQSAPVVFIGPDHHWTGFRPDLIALLI